MGKLFNRICNLDTLKHAWDRVQEKGAQGGIDHVSVAEFSNEADENLKALSKALLNAQYAPEPTERIEIPKFNAAGEMRPLSLPAIKDKVAQQAVRMVIEPLFERLFLECSFAYRPGKGPRKALEQVTRYVMDQGKKWAVLADIDNFFDGLDHDRLMREVKKVIYEPEILSLLFMWLKTGAMDQKGQYIEGKQGIAQGGIVSPLLSNIYAHPLDEYVTAQGMAYIRYADNLIVLCDSETESHACLKKIQDYIQDVLALKLNPENKPVRSVDEGFVFLGVRFCGTERFLADEKFQKIQRKLDWMTEKKRVKSLAKVIENLSDAVDGTRRYYGFLTPEEDFKKLDIHLLERMRVLMAAQWQQGLLSSRKDVAAILDGLIFFAATEKTAVDALKKRLLGQVFNSRRGEFLDISRRKPYPTSLGNEKKGGVAPPEDSKPLAALKPVEEPVSSLSARESPETGEKQAEKSASSSDDSGMSPDEKEKNSLAAAKRKVAAKKRKYVRQGALESEIIVQMPGSALGCHGKRVVLYKDRKKTLDLPLLKVKGICIQSRGVSLSSDLIEACAQSDIPLVFGTGTGLLPAVSKHAKTAGEKVVHNVEKA